MKELKKQGRPHDLHPFEGMQVEKVMIACDDVFSVAGQGVSESSEIIGVA